MFKYKQEDSCPFVPENTTLFLVVVCLTLFRMTSSTVVRGGWSALSEEHCPRGQVEMTFAHVMVVRVLTFKGCFSLMLLVSSKSRFRALMAPMIWRGDVAAGFIQ